jgi:hypothetical protein
MTCKLCKLYIVPAGGFLFEYFMWTCSSYSAHRRWSRVVGDLLAGAPISMDDENTLISHNLRGFVGWLLFHVASIGTNGRRQLFYITFLCQYYGLSRNGVDTLASFGYGLNNTMMDEMTADCSVQAMETSR